MKFTGRFGKIFELVDQFGSIALLNLVFVLFCIPVVTIPAALTALYSCTLSMARGEGYDLRRFWNTFRGDFGPSLFVGVVYGGVAGLVAVNLYLSAQLKLPAPVLYVQYAVLFLAAIGAAYAFPLVARFAFPLPQYIKLSLLLGLKNLPKTLVMLVLNFLPVIIFVAATGLFFRVAILWVVFGFALTAWLNARTLDRIFRPYTGQNDEEEE